jgi:hypothetical protein
VDWCFVSERSFDVYPETPLLDGAIGDVLAARNAAKALLSTLRDPGPDPTLLRTILTAVLLHVAHKGGGEARRQDLTRYLQDLRESGGASPYLERSHVQFVRYAAAELQALAPVDRSQLLQRLLDSVSLDRCGGPAGDSLLHLPHDGPIT